MRTLPHVRPLLLAVPLIAVLVLALGGCGMEGTNKGSYITGNSRVEPVAVADRGAPIDLTGTTLEGKPYDLAAERGKPVVINTWWSGCGPCNEEAPMLQEASEKLGGTATVVGINIRDSSAADGLAFERKYDATYPSIYSPDGKAVLAFPARFAPRTVPATTILDSEGRVAAMIRGVIPSALTLTETVQCVIDPQAQGCKGFE
jgi:thiol-disulfide isomerase/thioredoxin